MIEIKDSRRLTGPSILWNKAGAVLETFGPEKEVEAIISSWRRHADKMLNAVGWVSESVGVRRFPGGACLALSAPIDALYAATEVNEWAVEAAMAEIEGKQVQDIEGDRAKLRREIEEETNPSLIDLKDAAARHGISFLSDDDHASVGLGKGSVTYNVKELPAPGSIDWSAVSDIPVTIVTGTNGKSTTVRLLSSIVRAAGLREGCSSTDGIVVDGELVESGDYSGPEGARAILRNRSVDIAILETARGGILRRGLPVRKADVALVTNVAEDHLGEYGVNDLRTLVETKLVVHRAIDTDGLLVLNANDPGLKARGQELQVPVAWFSLDHNQPELIRNIAEGLDAAWFDNGNLIWVRQGHRQDVIKADEIPITLNGAAKHNIANSLAAILVTGQLGLPVDAMAEGLRGFEGSPEENPGRGNVFEIGGVTAIVDFAHNVHGFKALFEMSRAIPARRRLVLFGQAGDRTDASILEQVAVTWEARPDRIIIKEMEIYLRGREKGEVSGMIESELRRLGADDDMIGRADCEIDAVRQALIWARPGDLLLLLVYADRKETIELLRELQGSGWKPGDDLPETPGI